MKRAIFVFISILFASLSFANDKNIYTQNNANVYLNTNTSVFQGRIEPATPLTFIKKKNDLVLVELKGWSSEGSETVIFKNIGVRVIYAVLDEKIIKNIKILEKKSDYYETVWSKVSIKLWIKEKHIVKNINTVWEKSKTLYNERCGACHATPELEHFTANQWPGVIKSMASRAGLLEKESVLVTKYAQNKARRE